MESGVPQTYESPRGDCLVVSRRPSFRVGGIAFRAGLLLLGSLFTLIFASSALGATVHSGSDAARSGSASSATKGRNDPNQAAGRAGCGDMCGGCMGSGGSGGGEKLANTPTVVTEPPAVIVTAPTAGPTQTVAAGVPATSAAAVAPVAGATMISAGRPIRSITTAKKPLKKLKRHVRKHRRKPHGAGTQRSLSRPPLAQPVLPNERAAFTG